MITTKDLRKIYKHFGEQSQLEKLQEEVDEFIEAVKGGHPLRVLEEYADISVVLLQFAVIYGLAPEDITANQDQKIQRTLDRIKSGYYEEDKR